MVKRAYDQILAILLEAYLETNNKHSSSVLFVYAACFNKNCGVINSITTDFSGVCNEHLLVLDFGGFISRFIFKIAKATIHSSFLLEQNY